jgi:hypothetical protein
VCKVSERIRVDKLRRFSTFVTSLRKCTGVCTRNDSSKELQAQVSEDKFWEEHLVVLKESSRRRNRRSGFTEGTNEISSAVRSRGVAQGLSPSEQRRSHRDIGDIGVS